MERANTWTPAELEWLRDAYPDHHNSELAEMHAQAFPDRPRRTDKAIASKAKVLKLRKAEGFQRVPCTLWTPERAEWFRSFVPGHTEPEIAAGFEREFGFPLTKRQIANGKLKLGVKSGTHGGRFEKGMVPHNKGKKWDDYVSPEGQAASRRTCFRKGEVNGSALARQHEVGFERVNRDGYIEVKVADGLQAKPNCNFRMKHHVVYEQAHGEIPEGCNVVFADHDKRNFDPDNLVAVPRRLWAVIRHMGCEYRDAEGLRACMAIAELKMAVSDAERAPRACGSCGRTFKPRYPHQRTCDACLEAGVRGRRMPQTWTPKGEGTCEVCGATFAKRMKRQRRCDDCIAAAPRASVKEQRRSGC